jgi:hypothetical protein
MQALVFASLNSNLKVNLRACWLLLPLIFKKGVRFGRTLEVHTQIPMRKLIVTVAFSFLLPPYFHFLFLEVLLDIQKISNFKFK